MSIEPPVPYGAVVRDKDGTPRIGDWIQTYTGKQFYLLDPKPDDFDIRDIAHALSNQCRFTGHTKKFYSVAEHSVRVCELVRSWHKQDTKADAMIGYAALMHDASEAYLTDVARPYKHLPEFKFYRENEDRLMRHIADAFEFLYPFHPSIKKADEILLGTEARDLMGNPHGYDWFFRYEHLPETIRPVTPKKARRAFLMMYHELMAIIEG